jgi:uncharacterized protein (DUF4213/DUF364 family)
VNSTGHFPFVKGFKTLAQKLWVFELPGRGRPEDMTGAEIEILLPQAEIVVISSTTLINQTLGGVLDHYLVSLFLRDFSD